MLLPDKELRIGVRYHTMYLLVLSGCVGTQRERERERERERDLKYTPDIAQRHKVAKIGL
jgi:hypothetical protein